MDFMEKITELRAKKKALADQSAALVNEGKLDELNPITDQMEAINKNIQALERSLEASRAGAEPLDGYDGLLHDGKETNAGDQRDGAHPFASLGDQLQAIVAVAKSHTADKRLIRVNNAVQGANEGTGADGGFALQEDFAGTIIESVVQHSQLLNRLDRYTCSSPANSMRWVSVDETDVLSSVFGSVQMYWAAEGATVASSKPQLREMKLDLEKMMGIAYATDEMLQDAAFMTGFFGTAFSLAAERLLISGVIAGDGEGKPKSLFHISKYAGCARIFSSGKDDLTKTYFVYVEEKRRSRAKKDRCRQCVERC